MKKYLFILMILLSGLMFSTAQAQTCMDQNFVGSFVDTQACLDSNSMVFCGVTYSFIGGMAGALGALGYDMYAANKKPKLPFPLNDDLLDKYFKKVSASSTFAGLFASTDQLNDETVRLLKKKGYKVEEIEKIRKSLVDYRSGLADAQEKVGNVEDAELKERRAAEKVVKSIVQSPESGTQARKAMSEVAKGVESGLTVNESLKKFVLEGPGRTARNEIVALRERPGSAFGRNMISGTAGAALTGLGVALGPFIKDEVSIQKCKSKIGFKNDGDMSTFRSYGAVDFSDCRSEINPGKVWDLLLMQPSERNDLFRKSPALCKAFENSFINKVNYLNKRTPEVNLDGTQCGNEKITTEIKVRGHVYQQTITMQKIGMKLEGSFVSGNDLGDLKDFEKFSMQLKNDLSWTGIHTNNPTWGGIPGIQENFKTVSAAANPETFANFDDCDVLQGSQQIDRKMVNNPGSSRKLMCAVNEQALAAKAVLPRLLEYCDKKSKQNSQVFGEKAKAVKGEK